VEELKRDVFSASLSVYNLFLDRKRLVYFLHGILKIRNPKLAVLMK